MNTVHISVITGSIREGRFNDKAAAWIADELQKQDGVSVEILDLKEFNLPFFDALVSPSMKEEPYVYESVERFTDRIAASDAFVMVTPEYNHSTSAVLKNALDWVSREWNKKPVGFISYGSVGGARAIEHLRQIAIELQMAPIQRAVHIAGAEYFPVLFGQGDVDTLFAAQQKQADGLIEQLLWWTYALKQARN